MSSSTTTRVVVTATAADVRQRVRQKRDERCELCKVSADLRYARTETPMALVRCAPCAHAATPGAFICSVTKRTCEHEHCTQRPTLRPKQQPNARASRCAMHRLPGDEVFTHRRCNFASCENPVAFLDPSSSPPSSLSTSSSLSTKDQQQQPSSSSTTSATTIIYWCQEHAPPGSQSLSDTATAASAKKTTVRCSQTVDAAGVVVVCENEAVMCAEPSREPSLCQQCATDAVMSDCCRRVLQTGEDPMSLSAVRHQQRWIHHISAPRCRMRDPGSREMCGRAAEWKYVSSASAQNTGGGVATICTEHRNALSADRQSAYLFKRTRYGLLICYNNYCGSTSPSSSIGSVAVVAETKTPPPPPPNSANTDTPSATIAEPQMRPHPILTTTATAANTTCCVKDIAAVDVVNNNNGGGGTRDSPPHQIANPTAAAVSPAMMATILDDDNQPPPPQLPKNADDVAVAVAVAMSDEGPKPNRHDDHPPQCEHPSPSLVRIGGGSDWIPEFLRSSIAAIAASDAEIIHGQQPTAETTTASRRSLEEAVVVAEHNNCATHDSVTLSPPSSIDSASWMTAAHPRAEPIAPPTINLDDTNDCQFTTSVYNSTTTVSTSAVVDSVSMTPTFMSAPPPPPQMTTLRFDTDFFKHV